MIYLILDSKLIQTLISESFTRLSSWVQEIDATLCAIQLSIHISEINDIMPLYANDT